ncbi:MAG: hypothetical protein JO323_11610 [Acidobacteriia bacterium]|nr:hypothetical protein [Terriglobia bacterium]
MLSHEVQVDNPAEPTGPQGGRRGMMRVPWVSGMRPGHGYDYGARAALACPFATVPPDTWPVAATSLSSDLRIYRVESVEDLQEKLKIQEDVKGSYALFSSGISGQFIRSVSINGYSLYFLIKAYAINQEEFVSEDLTRYFSPEARGMPAGDFQNSYGDYYVAGRVKGSAFFALLEVKTQSDEVKTEIIKELNVGLQAGELPGSFAATFGAQFRKAATHQGVSFALHVAEYGVGPDVIGLANNIAPEYAADDSVAEYLAEVAGEKRRVWTKASGEAALASIRASDARKNANALLSKKNTAQTEKDGAERKLTQAKTDNSPEKRALDAGERAKDTAKNIFEAAVKQLEKAGTALSLAVKPKEDAEEKEKKAYAKLEQDEQNARTAKLNTEADWNAANQKYETTKAEWEAKVGPVQTAFDNAVTALGQAQQEFDRADAAAKQLESSVETAEKKAKELKTDMEKAETEALDAVKNPPAKSEVPPPPSRARKRTLDAYDDCINVLIEAATKTKEQAVKYGQSLYALIMPYSVLPNSPLNGRNFNTDRLDLIYQRLDRAYRNAKLILNSVSYALEVQGAPQFSDSREKLESIRSRMVTLIEDIHQIDLKLKINPDEKISKIPAPPDLALLPRRLWSGFKDKIEPPPRMVPEDLIAAVQSAHKLAGELKLDASLKQACLNYCRKVNEGIREAYVGMLSFTDDFNTGWKEIRTRRPEVESAKAKWQQARSDVDAAVQKVGAAGQLLLERMSTLEMGEGGNDPQVAAAQAELMQAQSEETAARGREQQASKQFAAEQATARTETLDVCKDLTANLNRHKIAIESFLLESKTAFERLTGKAKENGVPGEAKAALERFQNSCETDLNQRLWADPKDSVGSLKAFNAHLSPILDRLEKKLEALPADENPSQYIEFDSAIWESFRKRFQKAASDWRALA